MMLVASTVHACMPAPLCACVQVMREFGFLVRVCTAREATNFGIFLNEIFAMVERWRVSRGDPPQPPVDQQCCPLSQPARI